MGRAVGQFASLVRIAVVVEQARLPGRGQLVVAEEDDRAGSELVEPVRVGGDDRDPCRSASAARRSAAMASTQAGAVPEYAWS